MSARAAIVTGAGRQAGIGAAIARALARDGIDLFLTGYSAYDARQPWGSAGHEVTGLLDDLRASGVTAAHLDLDLSAPDAAGALFDAAEAAVGPVTILVNNAAYSTPSRIDALTADVLDQHYAVNVRGMALLCAAFVRHFRGDSGGRIVNLTSGQGAGPMPEELAYAASKGAVDAFTVSLSAAVAPRGITVNAVDPGPTDTGWMSPEQREAWAVQAPGGRVGRPEDAARLVRFLVSPEAAWITGQIIRSRGGL